MFSWSFATGDLAEAAGRGNGNQILENQNRTQGQKPKAKTGGLNEANNERERGRRAADSGQQAPRVQASGRRGGVN